ncbi:DUF3383 family protein [Serratia aquatilis]|uniref:DUF3383 family protein n=1 Tax=Serratia aquatilis TaxID=1737515 RepID=A0ABV6EEH0_9GAMM
MAYPVDDIIPINLILTSAGLGYANFSSAFIFADASDLASGSPETEKGKTPVKAGASKIRTAANGFLPDTYRDYGDLDELREDFDVASDVYLIAKRYFAQIPRPPQISVWMKNPKDGAIEVTASKANEAVWRYHYFFKNSDLKDSTALTALSDWCDATEHPVWFTSSDDKALDPQAVDALAMLAKKGNRHMFGGYKAKSSIETDPSQAYAMVQLAAAFHKFRPVGTNTSITGEYQVLPGITGDDLKTAGYNALKAKKAVFFTQIELAGQFDNSRVINSRSMSSYDEFIDDVVNLDVLKNHLQVDGYNYIANVGTKRGLTTREYGGLLDTLGKTCKRFYDNGVLGMGAYTDSKDGLEKLARFGFVIRSKPEDLLRLSPAQRRKRVFPPTDILVILSRAGHVAEINVTVE